MESLREIRTQFVPAWYEICENRIAHLYEVCATFVRNFAKCEPSCYAIWYAFRKNLNESEGQYHRRGPHNITHHAGASDWHLGDVSQCHEGL